MRSGERLRMGARIGSCLLKVLAAVCFAIVIMAVVSDRILAATQMSRDAQIQISNCPHPREWQPTDLELHRILARHIGWLKNKVSYLFDAHVSDVFFHHVNPAFLNWRREASTHPEQATLCNAKLTGAKLINADLTYANLVNADLSHADLSHAELIFAELTSAKLYGANLNGADLRNTYLSDNTTGLSSANLNGTHLNYVNLEGTDLNGAHLNGADLDSASLDGAKLTGANLNGA